jgi:hypothetical protein
VRRPVTVAVVVGLLASVAIWSPVAAASYALELSDTAVQAGDTVTITPVVGDVTVDHRCAIVVERMVGATITRMMVASDDCEPWTFTVPVSEPGAYVVRGWLRIAGTDEVLAPAEHELLIGDGGAAVPFESNYPVQSWDPLEAASTATPTYREPMTIEAPPGADGCALRILGGFELSVVHQEAACEAWTFTIPPRVLQGPVDVFLPSADIRVIGWTGASSWADQRPDAAMIGARYGEMYVGIEPFAAGAGMVDGYESSLPAIFMGAGRNHVAYVGDETPFTFRPVLVGAEGGSCWFSEGNLVTPIVDGACEAAVEVEPWLGETNAVRIVRASLVDGEGRTVATAQTDIGYILPLAPVEVDLPTDIEVGEDLAVEGTTAEGVPATYAVSAQPVVAASGRAPAASTTIASGKLHPTLETVGGSISVDHAFSTPGRYRVTVAFRDIAGTRRTGSAVIDVVDTTPPVTTAPTAAFGTGSALSAGKVPVKLSWGGDTTGIARYELVQSTDDAPWTTVATSLTTASAWRSLLPGHRYRFRVRAVDTSGNVGAWATAPTFGLGGYGESAASISYGGSWPTATSPLYLGGSARRSATAGATARFTFSGRSFGWLSRFAPDRGKATVTVDGSLVATIDLARATVQPQRIAWAGTWSTVATRTVVIRVNGTVGRPLVDVDGFFVVR